MNEIKPAQLPPADFVTVENVEVKSGGGRQGAIVRVRNACDFTVSGVCLSLSEKMRGNKRDYLPMVEVAGLCIAPGEEVTLPPIAIPPKWKDAEAELLFIRAGDAVCRLLEDGTIERTYGTLPPREHANHFGKPPKRNRIAFCRKTAIVTAIVSAVLIFGLGLLGLFVAEAGRNEGRQVPAAPPEHIAAVNIQGDIERI